MIQIGESLTIRGSVAFRLPRYYMKGHSSECNATFLLRQEEKCLASSANFAKGIGSLFPNEELVYDVTTYLRDKSSQNNSPSHDLVLKAHQYGLQ